MGAFWVLTRENAQIVQFIKQNTRLWCETPKQHHFCATEIEGSKFPRFLIPLVETLLLVVWSNCPNRFLFGPKLTKLFWNIPFGQMMSYNLDIVILLYMQSWLSLYYLSNQRSQPHGLVHGGGMYISSSWRPERVVGHCLHWVRLDKCCCLKVGFTWLILNFFSTNLATAQKWCCLGVSHHRRVPNWPNWWIEPRNHLIGQILAWITVNIVWINDESWWHDVSSSLYILYILSSATRFYYSNVTINK